MIKDKFHLSLLPQYEQEAIKIFQDNTFKNQLKTFQPNNTKELIFEIDNNEYLEYISDSVGELIINIIKIDLLKDYIHKKYKDLNLKEIEEIYNCSVSLFDKKEYFIKSTIMSKVNQYIRDNNYLDIEGFLKFRMKEFNKYIEMIGDIALEEYLIKRDQEEFIKVLRQFVSIQTSKISLIRICIKSDGEFDLYDEYGNKVENTDDEDIINLVMKENLNNEDFLISSLLTLCPQKIEILDLLNNNASFEIINTIEMIFDGRVNVLKN